MSDATESWIVARSRAGGSAERLGAPLHVDPPAPAARPAPTPVRSVFGELLVLRGVRNPEGRHSDLPLTFTEETARAVRGALLRHAVDPPPAALSGHTPDGRRLKRAHAAFLALPDLRSRFVAGAAIVLPREIEPEEHQAILLAAARWERSGLRLLLGRLGTMQLARVDSPIAGDSLDTARWLGPSRRWATVTPIALHHNPGDLDSRDPAKAASAAHRAEEIISRACAHIFLPQPTRVRVSRHSMFSGVPSAPEFMPFPRKPGRAGSDKFTRVCVHAEICFEEAVAGPVLLGAGRYFGLGLSKPHGTAGMLGSDSLVVLDEARRVPSGGNYPDTHREPLHGP